MTVDLEQTGPQVQTEVQTEVQMFLRGPASPGGPTSHDHYFIYLSVLQGNGGLMSPATISFLKTSVSSLSPSSSLLLLRVIPVFNEESNY